MKKKIIAFSCLAWAIVVLSSPTPAKAVMGIYELTDITKVFPTNHYRVGITRIFCKGDEEGVSRYEFTYEQLMAIPGVGAVWVPTDQIYNTGPTEATLSGGCETVNGDNFYIYNLSLLRGR